MNTAYEAAELGFVMDNTKVDSTGNYICTIEWAEDIILDGFKLPKYLPPVVMYNDKEMHFLRYLLQHCKD